METQKYSDTTMMTKAFSILLLLVGAQNISGAETSSVECPEKLNEGRTNLVFTHPDTGIALRGIYTIKKSDTKEIEVLSFRGVSCRCEQLTCQCCVGLDVSWLPKMTGCVSTTYIPEDAAVKLALKFNDKELVSTTISIQNPIPLCVRIPFAKGVEACVIIRKIESVEYRLKVCIDLAIRKSSTQYFVMQFKCIQVGAVVAQVESLPEPAVLNLSVQNEEAELNHNANSKSINEQTELNHNPKSKDE